MHGPRLLTWSTAGILSRVGAKAVLDSLVGRVSWRTDRVGQPFRMRPGGPGLRLWPRWRVLRSLHGERLGRVGEGTLC
jgi:hypothetical protein